MLLLVHGRRSNLTDAFCEEAVYFLLNVKQRPCPQTSPPAGGANSCLDAELAHHTASFFLTGSLAGRQVLLDARCSSKQSFTSFHCCLDLCSGSSFLYILASLAASYTVHPRLHACPGYCFALNRGLDM